MPRKRKTLYHKHSKIARAILKDFIDPPKPLTLAEQNRIADKKFYDYMRAKGYQEEADYFEPITAELWD